jgi:hypothetical protein
MDHKFNPKNEDLSVKNIETEEQFWLFIRDAKNQFEGIRFMDDKSDKELIEFRNKRKYLKIDDYLKSNNRTLSDKIRENKNVQSLIRTYDDIAERVKVFSTKEELKQIFEELDEYFERFNLGIEKNPTEFEERINDMKGQINIFRILLSLKSPIDRIKREQNNLKRFNEILESFGEDLPVEVKNKESNQRLIKFYDDIIERLKKFNTEEELKQILEDSKNLPNDKE